MSKHHPPCPACQEPCADMARRFDPVLRFVCPDCFHFLQRAEKELRKVGIEGVHHAPARFNPVNPEPETP